MKQGKQVVISKKPSLSSSVDLMTLGEAIKYKRTSLGLSIKKTSELCQISDKTLQSIENGKDSKTSSVLHLANMLGLKIKIEGL
ncbi:MAG: helix-turn-helix transcriptional regulator [Sulfurimonas sp.]|nr:helix-turn-helix transcriptional regulator [Sulfurimonas sp.]